MPAQIFVWFWSEIWLGFFLKDNMLILRQDMNSPKLLYLERVVSPNFCHLDLLP